ncbi:MAG: M28 family peptidase [Candidatus Udaeobacter sp.]
MHSAALSKILFSALRITVAVVAVLVLLWWFGMRMPGKNVSKAGSLSPDEVVLREELRSDVQKLAGEIGERNMSHYAQLTAAADFIEDSFSRAGLRTRRDSYEIRGQPCHNIEAEISGSQQGAAFAEATAAKAAVSPGHRSLGEGGSPPPIIIIGAHYDSVFGSPGANDNGTGVAATLALARRFASTKPKQMLRFVAFVNEEPPYFLSGEMGSQVYARRCKERGDNISAMVSLETIGYFSDAPDSQTYPSPGLGLFYPNVGNFIGFVSNVNSRALLRHVIALFRQYAKIPSEGASLPAFIPGVSWSDQWSFWQHGYRALMVTDTAPFRYPYYHSSSDTPDKLDYDRFTLVVSGMEKVIEELAK